PPVDRLRAGQSRPPRLPGRRDAAARRARRAPPAYRAGPGAGGARLDRRRLAVRAVDLGRRSGDLAAERARRVGAPAGDPARSGGWWLGAPLRDGRLVRARARVLAGGGRPGEARGRKRTRLESS